MKAKDKLIQAVEKAVQKKDFFHPEDKLLWSDFYTEEERSVTLKKISNIMNLAKKFKINVEEVTMNFYKINKEQAIKLLKRQNYE
jgi:hypothetical protein